jgi:hypothetical protein
MRQAAREQQSQFRPKPCQAKPMWLGKPQFSPRQGRRPWHAVPILALGLPAKGSGLASGAQSRSGAGLNTDWGSMPGVLPGVPSGQ